MLQNDRNFCCQNVNRQGPAPDPFDRREVSMGVLPNAQKSGITGPLEPTDQIGGGCRKGIAAEDSRRLGMKAGNRI